MVYIIKGDPIALARPRVGGKKVYDAQKHEKLVAGIDLRNQHGKRSFYSGPLHLRVVFYLKLPRDNHIQEGDPHISKPDLSNLIKFIEDIGTGILYEDDKWISCIEAHKVYGKEPRTEFTIEEKD